MGIRAWFLLCWLGVLAGGLQAQTAEDAEKALRAQLVAQRLVARGFSADAEIHYQWTATSLVMHEPRLRTFGVVEVSSIKLKRGQVEIRGERETLLKDKDKLVLSGRTPVHFLVDLGAADPITVLPQLKNQLFFGTLDEALAAIPKSYQPMIPYNASTANPPSTKENLAAETCGSEAAEFKRPVVVSTVEPEFSEEARRQKYNGIVSVVITVDKTGHAVDPWLARSAGHGLDENAILTVRQYVFKPATCSGVPVAFALAIDVKFAIF